MSDCDIIAAHFAAHGVDDVFPLGYVCTCGERVHVRTGDLMWQARDAHVAQTWEQSRTITTRAQLDALPVGTVVRDHEADIMVYGPTGEGESSWWYDGDPHRANEVDLPALVVWTPADGGDQ